MGKEDKEFRPYEMRYRDLFENMLDAFALHEMIFDFSGKPVDYRFLDVNPAFEELTGLKAAEIKNKRVKEVLPNTEDYWIENYGNVVLTGKMSSFQDYSKELNRYYNVKAYKTGPSHFAVIFNDVTQIKKAELEKEITIQLLHLINSQDGLHIYLKNAVNLFKEFSMCEAVGIRLKDGDDYPYFETAGFSNDFIKKENWLCTKDKNGNALKDAEGKPLLQCMCGNILNKKIDPGFPFFTSACSFWTNAASELMDEFPEAAYLADYMGTCGKFGYESIALIPLRVGDETLGLLQLNDKRKGLLSLDKIKFLEYLAEYFAVGLAKKKSDTLLAESEKHFRMVAENVSDVIWVMDPQTGKFKYISSSIEKLSGYKPDESLKRTLADMLTEEALAKAQNLLKERIRLFRASGNVTQSFVDEIGQVHKNGDIISTEITTTYVLNHDGELEIFGVTRDITERKKTEKELSENKKFLESITGMIPDIYYLLDVKSQCLIYINKDMEEVLRFLDAGTKEEMMEAFLNKIHSDDLPEVLRQAKNMRAADDNVICSMECRIKGKKGEYYWLYFREMVYKRDSSRQPAIIFGICQDITGQKKIHEALHESENASRAVLNSITDAAFLIDVKGAIIASNDELASRLNCKKENLTGKNIFSLLPEDVAKHRKAKFNWVVKSGMKIRFVDENAGRIVDNSLYPIYNADGSVKCVAGLGRDITESKKAEEALRTSEEKYRRIVETSNEGILIVNENNELMFINKRLEEMFGYTSDETNGRKIQEFMHEEDVADHKSKMKKRKTGIGETYERRFIRKDGTELITFISETSMMDEDGKFDGSFAMVTDITERKKAEESLKKSEAEYHELYTLMRLMSDTMPDMLWAKDLDNKYIFANKAMCESVLNAKDTLEPLGKTDLFFAERERKSHPENPEWHTFGELCINSDVVTLKEMKEMQFDEFGNVKGKFIYLDVHKAPLFNYEGKLIGIVGSARDITVRKIVEKALKESEARYYSIFYESPLGMWEGDFSEVKLFIDKLKNEGISDLSKYFDENSDAILAISKLAQIKEMNKASLKMLGAESPAQIKERLHQIFTPESLNILKESIISLTELKSGYSGCMPVKNFRGKDAYYDFIIEIQPGYEESLSRVMMAFSDITERRNNEKIVNSRFNLITKSQSHSSDELLTLTLDEIEIITGSKIGFYHFVGDDQNSLELQNWSTNTLINMCTAEGKGSHYPINAAGVWAECVSTKRPVIHNDYASLPDKKGFPEGHAPVIREAVVPIFRGNKMVAIIGVGNKPEDYTDSDVDMIWQLGDLSWDIVDRKRNEEESLAQKNLLSSIFESSPYIIAVVDRDGTVQAINRKGDEFIGKGRDEVFDRLCGNILGCINSFKKEKCGQTPNCINCVLRNSIKETFLNNKPSLNIEGKMEFVVDGINTEYYLIISATPVKQKNTDLALVTIVDITDRKRAEKSVILSEKRLHSALTIAHAGNWEVDLKTGKIWISDDVWDMLGFEKAKGDFFFDELLGRTPAKYKKSIEAAFNRLRTVGGEYEEEFQITHLMRGDKRYIHSIAETVYNTDGEKIAIQGVMQDVTERMKMTDELKESEERYRHLVELSPDALLIHQKGVVVYVNTAALKLFGAENQSQIIGTRMIDWIHADFRAGAAKRVKDIILTGNMAPATEEKILKMDGTVVDAEVIASHFVYMGKPAIQVIIRDISERNIFIRALKLSEERFRHISSTISDIAYSCLKVDGVYRLDWLTGAALNVTGYSNDEIMERQCWGFMVVKEDMALFEKNVIGLLPGQFAQTELRIRKKNGEPAWVNAFTECIEEKSDVNVHLLYGGLVNITERKLIEKELIDSEERFRTLIENVPDGLELLDLNGNFLQVNSATCTQLGYSRDELLSMNIIDIIPDMTVRTFKAEFENVQIGQAISKEFMRRRKDGLKYPAELTAGRIKIGGNERLLVSVRDISGRRKTEMELNLYRNHLEQLVKERTNEIEIINRRLIGEIEKEREVEMMLRESLNKEKELNELKNRFISTASHEFKTPLTTILSSVELIQRYGKGWDETKLEKHITRVQNSVDHLSKLIDDVLTISRSDTGKLQNNPVQLDLYELCNKFIEDVKLKATPKHELLFKYNSVSNIVNLDPKLMRFIINNLLTNAIKYSPEGGTVELKVDVDNQFIQLSVKDKGIGLAPEDEKHLCEPFFRARNALEFEGTGLGLSIVKRSVEVMNGEIYIKSKLNKGTMVEIFIPR